MVTAAYQENILRFFLQCRKESRNYFNIVSDGVFDTKETKLVYDLIKSYVELRDKLPSQTDFIQFVVSESVNKGVKRKELEPLERYINSLYTYQIDVDLDGVKETLLEYAQSKEIRNLFQKYAGRVGEINNTQKIEYFSDLIRDVKRIVGLEDETKGLNQLPLRLLNDFESIDFSITVVDGIPTKYQGLNDCLLSKGLKGGEILIVLAGPKAGKTTLMINFAVGFTLIGKKVLYLDLENGRSRIRRLYYQCIAGLTGDCFKDESKLSVLEASVKRAKMLGGDFIVEELDPDRSTADDVRDIIQRCKEELKFTPDVIVVDYLDKMAPTTKAKDKRLGIQTVYMDFKRLGREFDAPIISASLVNRAGMDKEHFKSSDISEDIGKVANADFIVAFPRTLTDRESNRGKLVVLDGRDVKITGKPIPLFVDLETATITEITDANVQEFYKKGMEKSKVPKADENEADL